MKVFFIPNVSRESWIRCCTRNVIRQSRRKKDTKRRKGETFANNSQEGSWKIMLKNVSLMIEPFIILVLPTDCLSSHFRLPPFSSQFFIILDWVRCWLCWPWESLWLEMCRMEMLKIWDCKPEPATSKDESACKFVFSLSCFFSFMNEEFTHFISSQTLVTHNSTSQLATEISMVPLTVSIYSRI